MTEQEKSSKKLALAHRMLEAAASPVWRDVLLPYIEQERLIQIDLMASQTEALQLMRYAGAVQALKNLSELEARARQVIEQENERNLGRFGQPQPNNPR
jgi:hypothetical protein